jgi:sterol desaturase/sphingolipid hydroxylase (fatty acid hydroxylase superfamily)
VDAGLRFALIVAALHSLTFFGLWGVFALMFRHGIAASRQVAGGKAPPAELVRRSAREALLGHVLFGVVVYLAVYPLWRAAGGRLGAPWPGALEVAWQLLAFVLINDTIFYWSHRALHLPALYKRVHVRHHRFRHVRGPSAEYAHVLENVANFVAFFAGPCLIGGHMLTLCLWVVIRMAETVEAHSGYALTQSASRHAFHHMYAAKGCYGSFFSLWDYALGSDRLWRAARREAKASQPG